MLTSEEHIDVCALRNAHMHIYKYSVALPFALVGWSLSASSALADDIALRLSKLEQQAEAARLSADISWIVIAAGLVLLMQIGFLLLEAGAARSKHSINVALKNTVDFMIAAAMFWVVGYGLMFGASLSGLIGEPALLGPPTTDPKTLAFFLFQMMFVSTAATIVSGAVAERMSFSGYLILTAAISVIVYPVFGHWAWGNALIEQNASWLAKMGFIDFAGSTVVHSIGGWVALAGLIILGARRGRFGADGSPRPMPGHSVILSSAGALILFVGWIGFNAGSTLSASPDIAKIAVNTILAGAVGSLAAMAIGRLLDGHWGAGRSLNGLLGGLVGITASCAIVSPAGAVAIGLITGSLVILAEDLILKRFRLDDVVGAVAVHGVGGVAGTLLVAAFGDPAKFVNGSHLDQLMVQAIGAAVAFAWAFLMGLVLFGGLSALGLGRVSEEDEDRGLNAAEHGATLGTGALQAQLSSILLTDRDLSKRLDETSGDETAEIAAMLNPFIAEMQKLMGDVSDIAAVVASTATQLAAASSGGVGGATALADGTREMSEASSRMGEKVGQLGSVTDSLHATSDSVASATWQMSTAMDQVKDLMARLVESVNAVALSADQGADISGRAVKLVGAAQLAMGSLTAATEEIEAMATLIENVADRTNLLALNATIEAARAGDAGRGFAVVASEVKQLASETTRATDDIRARVEQVRTGGLSTSRTVDEVRAIFEELDATMAAIASSARTQHSLSADVAREAEETFLSAGAVIKSTRAVHDDVRGLTDMSQHMARDSAAVSRHANETRSFAAQSLGSAKEIAAAATSLDTSSRRLLVSSARYRT
jgi:ammonium transporter, Amt family